MNVDWKMLFKNVCFGVIVWILGLLVFVVGGAAYAAASGMDWLGNAIIMLYLLGSTVFVGWVVVNFISSHTNTNGKHEKRQS